MDILFPYLPRNAPPAEPTKRLIEPVSKYARFTPHDQDSQQRVGWQQHKPQQQGSGQSQQEQDSGQPAAEEPTHHYLPTSHPETPETEQHADADGHLDIYI